MLFYGGKDNVFSKQKISPKRVNFASKLKIHPFGGLTREINTLPLYFEN
jgi:hypothetical protein